MSFRFFLTLVVSCVIFCAQAQTVFYHDGTGYLHSLSNWFDDPSLSGSNPTSFQDGDTFVIHGSELTTTSSFSISGGSVLLLRGGCKVMLAADLMIGSGSAIVFKDSSELETGAFSLSGQGDLRMQGGNLIIGTLGNRVPELLGDYYIDSGAVIFNGNGDQEIRGSRSYHTLIIDGESGIKTFSSAITGSNSLSRLILRGRDTLDMENRTLGDGSTSLNLVSGHLRIAGTGTKPDASGDIQIDSASIEYYNSASTTQTIRNGITFHHLIISGTNVKPSTGNITLDSNGIFEVAESGVWDMTNTNVGIEGNEGSVVQIKGEFIVYHDDGLFGGTETAIRETVDSLEIRPGSLVNYASPSDQQVSGLHYANLRLTGTSDKQASSELTVSEGFFLSSGSKLILDTCKLQIEGACPGSGLLKSNAAQITWTENASGTCYSDSNAWQMLELKTHPDSSIQLEGSFRVDSLVLLSSGTLKTADNLLLLSAGDSSYGQLVKSGGNLLGNLGVELKINSGLGWRYFASPVQTDLADWHDSKELVYSGYGQNVFRWDAASNSWDGNLDSSNAFDAHHCYAIKIDSTDLGVSHSFFGPLNGSVQWSNGRLHYTSSGDTTTFEDPNEMDGWNMVGNPFPAGLQWEGVRNRVDGSVNQYHYVFDPESESYKAHNGVAGHSTLNGSLSPFQAVFIRLGDSADQYTEAFDFDSLDIALQRSILLKSSPSYCRLNLTNNERSAELMLIADTRAGTEFNPSYDAVHLDGGTDFQPVWITEEGEELQIKSLGNLSQGWRLQLKLNNKAQVELSGPCPLTPKQVGFRNPTGDTLRFNPGLLLEAGTYDVFPIQDQTVLAVPSPRQDSAFVAEGRFYCRQCEPDETLRILDISGNFIREINYQEGVVLPVQRPGYYIIQREKGTSIYFINPQP